MTVLMKINKKLIKKYYLIIFLFICIGGNKMECYGNILSQREEKAIVQFIEDYIEERNRLLIELDEGIHTIEPFYIKTQEGQDNMDYEKFLLAIQIGQRRVQPIDLKGKSILLKERDWSFKRLERNQIEVTVWIDEKIDYTALNLTSLNYNQKHIFKIVKSLDRWYVMHHEYEDEFKMLFNTYRNLDYKTMKEEYLRQVKEQIKAQGIVDEEQLNLYRVEDKGKKYHI